MRLWSYRMTSIITAIAEVAKRVWILKWIFKMSTLCKIIYFDVRVVIFLNFVKGIKDLDRVSMKFILWGFIHNESL